MRSEKRIAELLVRGLAARSGGGQLPPPLRSESSRKQPEQHLGPGEWHGMCPRGAIRARERGGSAGLTPAGMSIDDYRYRNVGW